MAVARFLHVGFNWTGIPKNKEIEQKVSKALDWIRYAPNCWILYTTTDAQEWFKRIKPLLGPGDHVLIHKLDRMGVIDHQGWLPRKVWDWFAKHSSPTSPT
jgi:hypothetical protein